MVDLFILSLNNLVIVNGIEKTSHDFQSIVINIKLILEYQSLVTQKKTIINKISQEVLFEVKNIG